MYTLEVLTLSEANGCLPLSYCVLCDVPLTGEAWDLESDWGCVLSPQASDHSEVYIEGSESVAIEEGEVCGHENAS